MARGIFKLVSAALAVTAAATAAHAGGFSRGTADTEILYEDSNFNLRAGATYVSPSRKYSSVPLNSNFVGYDPYDAYVIPSAAIKLNATDDLRCAGTMTQPYGGGQHWPIPYGSSGKRSEKFTTTEWGMTCGYKFDLAKGRLWLLGGLFYEDFNYDLTALATALAPDGAINVKLGANDWGYRIGAAYEIPEIALRAQLMYRSGTDYNADGTTTRIGTAPPPVAGLNGLPLNVTLPIAGGQGSLPQSIELKLQSGVAPGWLVFGSVKWTDWSVLDTLDLIIAPGATSQNLYYWKDGWTVQAGVGHAFNDKLSGAVSLTWDSGVGTGWDGQSDTWTLGVGGSYKPDVGGEMRFGTGLSYLTSERETQYVPILNNSYDSGWAIAFTGSYKVNW
jgi:long-chain fatty acid transport protein